MQKVVKAGVRAGSVLLAVVMLAFFVYSPLLAVPAWGAPLSSFAIALDPPVAGAQVTLTNEAEETDTMQVDTDAAGQAVFAGFVDDEKTYRIEVRNAAGYQDTEVSGAVLSGTLYTLSLTAVYTVAFTVQNEAGLPYSGAVLTFNGVDYAPGDYTALGVAAGRYDYAITPVDLRYKTATGSVEVADSDVALTVPLELKQYALTVENGTAGGGDTGGTISLRSFGSPETAKTVSYNAEQKAYIRAAAGYTIESVFVNDDEQAIASGLTSLDFSINTTDDVYAKTIKVFFTKIIYTVTFDVTTDGVAPGDGGSVEFPTGTTVVINEGEQGSVEITYGDTWTVSVAANTGYHIARVELNGGILLNTPNDNTKKTHSFDIRASVAGAGRIDGNVTVTVVFTLDKYALTSSVAGLGTIKVNDVPGGGSTMVGYGTRPVISLLPNDAGTRLGSLLVDGLPVSIGDITLEADGYYTYVLPAITGPTTVRAVFTNVPLFPGEWEDAVEVEIVSGGGLISPGPNITLYHNDTVLRFKPMDPYTELRYIYEDNYGAVTWSVWAASHLITSSRKIIAFQIRPNSLAVEEWTDVNITFAIDKTEPTIVLESEYWGQDSVTVEGTITDTGGGWVNNNRLYYSTRYADYVAGVGETARLVDGKICFTTTPPGPSTTYYVWGYDISGNKSIRYSTILKVDGDAPVVTKIEFGKAAGVTTDIGFRSFGTFFNNTLLVTIAGKDEAAEPGNLVSGVKSIAIYANGVFIESKDVPVSATGSALFSLSAAQFNNKEVSATITDRAGNTSARVTVGDPGVNSGLAQSGRVLMETDKPGGGIRFLAPDYTAPDGKVWFGSTGSQNFTVDVADPAAGSGDAATDSGLHIVQTTVNTTPLPPGGDYIDSQRFADALAKSTAALLHEGENTVAVTVSDNAGNLSDTISQKVYVDTTNPLVTGFSIEAKNTSAPARIINFLSFGNFFNEEVVVTITVKETGLGISGVGSISLWKELADGTLELVKTEMEITDLGGGLYSAEFSIPEEEIEGETVAFAGTLVAGATDNVGNVSTTKKPTEISGSGVSSDYLEIETIPPTATFTLSPEGILDGEGRAWFSAAPHIDLAVQDDNSGLFSVQVQVNGYELLEDENGVAFGAFSTKETVAAYSIDMDNLCFAVAAPDDVRDEDGGYLVSVLVVDNAGNETVKELIIYKDDQAPSIVNFTFRGAGNQDGTGEPVTETDYGFYFRENVTVTVYATDAQPSSGIVSMEYYTQSADGTTSATRPLVVNDDKATFVIPANFKGQVFVRAIDLAGNIPAAYSTPGGVIVENKDTHEAEEHIRFDLPETMYTDPEGRPLYDKDVALGITVLDSYSGLRKIEWAVTSPYGTESNASGIVEIGNDMSVDTAGGGAWGVRGRDKNLIIELGRTLSITNNSNGIEVWVKMTDRAGNVSESTCVFSIDKTAPVITVTYDNEDSDGTFAGYYKQARLATVVITERNLRHEDVLYSIENTLGGVPQVTGWTTEVNTENPDLTTHTALVEYSVDGHYTFNITARDMAGNQAESFVPHTFTIDMTIPLVQVSYNNEDVRNGFYYNAPRTATISVTEHNFDAGRVEITGSATDNGATTTFPPLSGWVTSGDVHTATIAYNADASYSFSIHVVDMAGNASVDYVTEEFVIDQTPPELEIEGIEDKSANRGELVPIVTYTDTNIDLNAASIILTGVYHEPVRAFGAAAEIPNGMREFLDIFAVNDEMTYEEQGQFDDLYTMEIEVADMAGNTVAQTLMFSVNRNGSVYIFDRALSTRNGQYTNEEFDVVLTEINVDKLVESTINLKVSASGDVTDLVENQDYTMQRYEAEGSWNQYEYTISKDLFTADGVYSVMVYSEDLADNINQNYAEYKKAEISFGIDKTAPVIIPLDINAGTTYPQESREANVSVSDNLQLQEVRILLNGQEMECSKEQDVHCFTMLGATTPQSVHIVARDAAGNETVVALSDIYVTTNLFIRWYTNVPVFIGTLVGLGAVLTGGVLWFILLAKRRKKKEEEAEGVE